MTINIYENSSVSNERNKQLLLMASITGTLKESCSIIDPVIRIEGTLPPTANYLYIPDFRRYYFINNIISIHNSLYEIHAHCDVLCSAGENLNNCEGIIRRQENLWNLYLDDGVFKAYSNPNIVQKAFPSGFSSANMCYVLAVAGS